MVMEPAQTVDVDRAVIHPDTLPDSGRPLEAKEDLVDQIEYVAHFVESLRCQRLTAGMACSEFAWSKTASTQSEVLSTARANARRNAAT